MVAAGSIISWAIAVAALALVALLCGLAWFTEKLGAADEEGRGQ